MEIKQYKIVIDFLGKTAEDYRQKLGKSKHSLKCVEMQLRGIK